MSPEGFVVHSLEETDSNTDKPAHINMHLIRYSSTSAVDILSSYEMKASESLPVFVGVRSKITH